MVKIAVSGCVHGELEIMYDTVRHLEQQEGTKIELLLCCGDFQSTRNAADLLCMAVPPKYRQMNTFYKYYTGELRAPVLTVFVGGNHEASNYLQELPYGGWVAPNIYYLGTAGCVNYRGLRIAGLSGIFKQHDYSKPHYECAPYSNDTMRSVYHTRAIDVFRLSLLAHSPAGEPTTTELHDKEIAKPDSALESAKDAKISEKGDLKVKKYNNRVDIVLSHDWPTNVYNHGDLQGLLRRKPYFRDEVLSGQLGSPPLESLLLALKPRYWFAAHLHCAFAALVDHTDSCKNQQKEQKTDESDSTVAKPPPTLTRFLALDKVLPRRHFLQILDIEPQDGAECDSDVHLEPHNDVESESDEPNAKVRKCDSSLASDVATANSDNAVKQDDVSHQSDATSPAQMELNKESERSADGGGLPEAESADDSQKLVESSPADAEKPAGVQLQSHRLHLDPVFLAVLRKTDSLTRGVFSNLDTDPSRYAPTIREVSAIEADFDHRFEVPDNFEMTTPCDVQPRNAHALAAQITVNPQTTLLCTMLDIRHPNAELANSRPEPSNQTEQAGQVDFDAVGRFAERSMGQFTDEKVDNPDEIHLSDDDEGDGEQ